MTASDPQPPFASGTTSAAVIIDRGYARLDRLLKILHPLSLSALLATLVLLFGFQGEQIVTQPLIIVLLAVPILIQVFFNAGRIMGNRRQ